MPVILPTPTKVWSMATLVSETVDNVSNQKDLLIKIKNQRVTFGNVIAGSSDGVTAGMDGVDRWMTPWPNYILSSLRAWMVITQPGSGAQDLIVHNIDFGESDWAISHSPSGAFTGGSITTPPTASDQNALYSNSWFGRGDQGSNPRFICHLWVSSDLTCCRQVFFCNSFNFGNLFYDQVSKPTGGWSSPNYGVADKLGFNIDNADKPGNVNIFMNELNGGGTGVFQSWGPFGQMQMTGTLEGSGVGNVAGRTSPLPNVVTSKNAISNTYRNIPQMGLFCNGANYGWHGRMVDVWWVPNNFNPGDETPLDGSDQFVVLNNMLLPWNGTFFQVT